MPFDRALAMRLIDREVLKVIEEYAGQDGTTDLNQDEIARLIPVSPSTVYRALKRLKTARLVKFIGGNKNRRYGVLKDANPG